MALAYVIGDKAEQAYRRGGALEKRLKLIDAWRLIASLRPQVMCGSKKTGLIVWPRAYAYFLSGISTQAYRLNAGPYVFEI